jgi:hypothetical protein
MNKQDLTHKVKCIGGRYKCVDCDFNSLNVVTAKAHFADNNDIDYELEDLF